MVTTRTLALCVGLAVLGIVPAQAADQAPAAIANFTSEIDTAITHARLAAAAKDVKSVHTHLHHTINCLVGPLGTGYDANELNPCQGMGGGALPDINDPAKKAILKTAAEHAEAGLKADDLAAAQKIATETQNQLKTVK